MSAGKVVISSSKARFTKEITHHYSSPSEVFRCNLQDLSPQRMMCTRPTYQAKEAANKPRTYRPRTYCGCAAPHITQIKLRPAATLLLESLSSLSLLPSVITHLPAKHHDPIIIWLNSTTCGVCRCRQARKRVHTSTCAQQHTERFARKAASLAINDI
jgi:hypothetical protein